MKYSPGDLMADFELKVFRKLKEPLKTLNWIRLATPGEKIIFERNFKETATFEEFKKKMPAFDSRRIKGIDYGSIMLDESKYLFFRSMQSKFHFTNFEDKLLELINSHERAILHNSETDKKEIEKARKFGRLLNEIKALINE